MIRCDVQKNKELHGIDGDAAIGTLEPLVKSATQCWPATREVSSGGEECAKG